ncbi:MAG TPA: SRPBCC family protein [Baekduia sp.]|nr:SRPBCC family protein [Baekduia sp.]
MEASTPVAALGLAPRERPAPGAPLLELQRRIGATPAAVFGVLGDLDRHWHLAGPAIRVLALDGPPGSRRGGRLRLLGPCGVRRTVRTRVTRLEPDEMLAGTASTASGSTVHVTWRVAPCGDGARVELQLAADRASALDAVVLRLGGRRWLRRRLQAALQRLAATAEATA